MRTCHNRRCSNQFIPRRADQKHCDTYCKEYCHKCRSKYYEKQNEKMRKVRRERGSAKRETI